MIKGRLDQLFVLEPTDKTAAADSTQLRVPTLEERVRLYLRAVYGKREVTREEYLRARNLILDTMVTHLKENSVAGLANEPAGVVDAAPGNKSIRLPDETIRWASARAGIRHDLVLEERAKAIRLNETLGAPSARAQPFAAKNAEEARARARHRQPSFDLGRRISEFLSSLTPRTLAWSATAAAVAILVPAAVITAVWNEIEQGPPSAPQMAGPPLPPLASLERKADPPPRAPVPQPDVAVRSEPRVTAQQPELEQVPGPDDAVQSAPTVVAATAPTLKLSDEEIAALVARGRQLMIAGDIRNARLVLEQAATARNAAAVLELGATYDPFILQQLEVAGQTAYRVLQQPKATGQTAYRVPQQPKAAGQTAYRGVESVPAMTDMANIEMARRLYEQARGLGSTEAAVRLDRLRSVPIIYQQNLDATVRGLESSSRGGTRRAWEAACQRALEAGVTADVTMSYGCRE